MKRLVWLLLLVPTMAAAQPGQDFERGARSLPPRDTRFFDQMQEQARQDALWQQQQQYLRQLERHEQFRDFQRNLEEERRFRQLRDR